MKLGALAAALLAGLSLASPAAAGDLWTSADGKSALELHAFYKTMATGLRMPSGLVEGTAALAALVPEQKALPPFGGQSANTARVWGRLVLRDRVELSAGWQLGMVAASDAAFVRAATLGSPLPASATQGASRRLVDFAPVLAEHGGFLLLHNLDRLAVKVRAGFADFTVGRQVLSWGSGRLWNPTDLLSPFGPTDLDREVRRGVDAVRASIPLSPTAQLDLLWLPQQAGPDQGAVLRAQSNLRGFDVAPSVAKYLRDVVLGFDVTGDIGPVAVHGEIAATVALDRDAAGDRDRFVRAVVGADVKPREGLMLSAEYYFNGWGATDPAGYLAVAQSARVTRGEVFGAGRHYLGLVAAWQATELLSVRGTFIGNLLDPSLLVAPALEYWADQKVLVRAGGYLPLGKPPDPGPLQRLGPADVTSQSAAWQRAVGSFGLRSEYGASPVGAFVQAAVYFL